MIIYHILYEIIWDFVMILLSRVNIHQGHFPNWNILQKQNLTTVQTRQQEIMWGDILANLRVKTDLTHGNKVPLENFLNFYFGLKYPQITFLEGGSQVARTLVLNSMCASTSQKWPFIPRISLLFPEITLSFSGSTLILLRNAHCFPELHFSMPKVISSTLNDLKTYIYTEYDFLGILFIF